MRELPLVMLHGWGMTPKAWNPLRICLSPRGFATPALPAHAGRRPAPAELGAWADALLEDLPQQCVLGGWSLGAMIALDLARRYPKRIKRLVLFSASPSFANRPVDAERPAWTLGLTPDTVDGFISGFEFDPDATLRRFVSLQILGGSRRRGIVHTLNKALASPQERDPSGLADGLRLLRDTDLRDDIAHIRQPVLLVHGRQDALMPLGAAKWLDERLPNSRLEAFDECGHAPFIAYPEACARLIQHEIAA